MGIEFAVPHDTSLGINLVEDTQYLVQSNHLLGRTVVLVLDIGAARMTTFVADADAVRVVALHMATSFSDRSAIEESTITSYINVIAWISAISFRTMTRHQLLDSEVLVWTSVRAVELEQVNLPR